MHDWLEDGWRDLRQRLSQRVENLEQVAEGRTVRFAC
jgi:hypothetical protein